LQTIRYCVEGRPSHLIFREHPTGEDPEVPFQATWLTEVEASTSVEMYGCLASLALESVQQPFSNPSKYPERLGKAS
jgi:hypothetical protein